MFAHPVMQLMEIRNCGQDLHSCSMFSECSILFRKIMTPSIIIPYVIAINLDFITINLHHNIMLHNATVFIHCMANRHFLMDSHLPHTVCMSTEVLILIFRGYLGHV